MCYIPVANTMLYIEEVKPVIQQLSDAELEIMKIVWGNPEEVSLVPLYHGRAGGKGKAVSKEYPDCTVVTADEKGFLECQENWPP